MIYASYLVMGEDKCTHVAAADGAAAAQSLSRIKLIHLATSYTTSYVLLPHIGIINYFVV